MERRRLIILSVAFEGGMLVLALFLGALFGLPPFATLRADLGSVIQGLVASLPMLGLLPLIDGTRWRLLDGLRRDLDRAVTRLFVNGRPADLALLSVLAGVGEEALFRGVIQTGLSGTWGPAAGMLAAGALFGLAHGISRSYAIYAAAVGVYLGGLLLVTENLLVPILVHALYDFVALTWLVRLRKPPATRPLPDGS